MKGARHNKEWTEHQAKVFRDPNGKPLRRAAGRVRMSKKARLKARRAAKQVAA